MTEINTESLKIAKTLITGLNSATKTGNAFNSILEKENGLLRYIVNNTTEDEDGVLITTLPPINLCLVAPTGAGKTTLISTVVQYLKDSVNQAAGFRIKSASPEDDVILNQFNLDLAKLLSSDHIRFSMNLLQGDVEPKKYTFNIELDYLVNKKKSRLILPFVIMDIPGAYLNPEKVSLNKDFEEHLNKSQIIWIPVDSPVLMEAKTTAEIQKSVELTRETAMHDLVQMWSQYINDMHEKTPDMISSVCIAAVKCEKYIKDKKNELLKSNIMNRYSDSISLIRENSPKTNIYYMPVQTVGCINLSTAKWGETEATLETAYAISGNKQRKITGADGLLYSLFDYSVYQLEKRYANDVYELEKLIKNSGFIDWLFGRKRTWKDIEKDLKDIRANINPMIAEISRLRDSARNSSGLTRL